MVMPVSVYGTAESSSTHSAVSIPPVSISVQDRHLTLASAASASAPVYCVSHRKGSCDANVSAFGSAVRSAQFSVIMPSMLSTPFFTSAVVTYGIAAQHIALFAPSVPSGRGIFSLSV